MDQPWLANYAPGVPYEIDPDRYPSLVALFDGRVKTRADEVAFINMGATLTYQQLHDQSVLFAAYLQGLGLQKGARVAVMMPNLLQYTVALVGILRAGLVVVNVNPLYTAPEIKYQLNDAGCEAIIVVANFAATLAEALPCIPSIQKVMITEVGDLMGVIKGNIVNFIVKHIKGMVPQYRIPDAITFKQLMRKAAKLSFQPVDIVSSDIAFLQYTGGTTGTPKGAMLTHRNMIANVLQSSIWVSSLVNQDDVVVAALPMYHIFSLTVCCLAFIYLGAHCLLVTNPRHMKSFLKILKNNKVSVFVGINTLFNSLMNQATFKDIDFSSLKLTVAGGMAVQQTVAERWQEITGCHIIEGYGLTESSPVVTINPVTNKKFNGSIGLPISSTQACVRDEAGNALALGEIGELCVKGPQVMRGYWQHPDDTAKVLDKEGWLRTGDMARIDQQGYITIVDRKKDIILVSGFNVYPNEIEEVIASMPGVVETAVIGIPSDKTGEAIKAFVVLDNPDITKEQVIDYCRKHLTRYKLPKIIEFRNALPKSNVGKVLRRELKQQSLSGPTHV